MKPTLRESFKHGAIEIRRHTLDNGLTVLCLKDNAAPIVSFQTWLHVGSSDEHVGKTGIAHLFEHLMFNQTENMAPGEFDRRVESMGGDSNAATWVDWTYYRTSAPSSMLNETIEIEADRFANLVLEIEPLETEREVVANERLQRVEDDVDGFVDEELFKLAYPSNHPYHAPTIGWMKDIKQLSLEDARSFYKLHYSANNAVLVIAGDFNEAKLLEKIHEHYGELPKVDVPKRAQIPSFSIEDQEYSYRKPVSAAKLVLGFAAPPQSHDDWQVLSLISSFLGAGASSELYRALAVEKQIASSVDCSVMPFRGPSLFQIGVNLLPNANIEDALVEIQKKLSELATQPIQEADLKRAKAGMEMDFWLEMDTLDGRAEAIGHSETTLGDFRKLFDQASRFQEIEPQEVQRICQKYLVDAGSLTLKVHP